MTVVSTVMQYISSKDAVLHRAIHFKGSERFILENT